MAASDKLSKQQFVRVYHNSDSSEPPHLVNHPNYDTEWEGDVHTSSDNVWNHSLNMGTRSAAKSMHRKNLHAYDIPTTSIEHKVWGDEELFMHHYRQGKLSGQRQVHIAIEDLKKEKRWRGIPVTEAFSSPMGEQKSRGQKAIPYLNMVENAGSISYIVPKTAIHENNIIYRGLEK